MNQIKSFGQPLAHFRNQTPQTIFKEAITYPDFFNKHLVHPLRRIKVLLNDPNANIRAFYFQYLLLCYEIDNQNYQFYIGKLQKFILDPNFHFLFLENDDERIFNDLQFKRIILEFMEVLDYGEFQTIQLALNTYPIADLALVYFFRSLAICAEITHDFDTYIEKNVLFGFLLQNFNIDAQIFQDKCIKFIEAQVFVYQQSPSEIYLVYKDIENSGIDQDQDTQSKSSHENSQQINRENSRGHTHSRSMVSSKKSQQFINQNQQTVQKLQNISVLDNDSNQQYQNQNHDQSFKKYKDIINIQDNNRIIKQQFQQQKSVFSRQGDQQLSSQLESYDESRRNSQLAMPEMLINLHANSHTKTTNENIAKSIKIASQNQSKINREQSFDLKNNYQNSYNMPSEIKIKSKIQTHVPHTPYFINPQKQKNLEQKWQPKLLIPKNDPYEHMLIPPAISINSVTSSNSNSDKIIKQHQQFIERQKQRYQNQNQIPATRDVPTHDHHYEPITANIHSRQSLAARRNNNQQQQVYGQYQNSQNESTNKNNFNSYTQNQYTNHSQNPNSPNINILQPRPNSPPSYTPLPTYTPNVRPPLSNPTKNYNMNINVNVNLNTKQQNQSINLMKQNLRQNVMSKLSVSKQFTDSITLMKMGEPYCTNIRRMKSRCREFRQSIFNTLK